MWSDILVYVIFGSKLWFLPFHDLFLKWKASSFTLLACVTQVHRAPTDSQPSPKLRAPGCQNSDFWILNLPGCSQIFSGEGNICSLTLRRLQPAAGIRCKNTFEWVPSGKGLYQGWWLSWVRKGFRIWQHRLPLSISLLSPIIFSFCSILPTPIPSPALNILPLDKCWLAFHAVLRPCSHSVPCMFYSMFVTLGSSSTSVPPAIELSGLGLNSSSGKSCFSVTS